MAISDTATADPVTSERRIMGIALVAATLLTLLALAFHPSVNGNDDVGQTFAAIARVGLRAALVHGIIIAIFVAFAIAFSEFATLLGLQRPLVRAGLIAYSIGCIAIIFAGLLDGFVIAAIARRFVLATPDDAKIGFDLIVLTSLMLQSLTKLGLILMSAGILGWSVALFCDWPGRRGTALAGAIAGLAPPVFLLTTGSALGPHLLIIIFLSHATWNIAAAQLLMPDSG